MLHLIVGLAPISLQLRAPHTGTPYKGAPLSRRALLGGAVPAAGCALLPAAPTLAVPALVEPAPLGLSLGQPDVRSATLEEIGTLLGGVSFKDYLSDLDVERGGDGMLDAKFEKIASGAEERARRVEEDMRRPPPPTALLP